MELIEVLMLIRTLSETSTRLFTILDTVEDRAGKPLDQLSNDELVSLLRQETRTFDDLLEEGKRRAREGG